MPLDTPLLDALLGAVGPNTRTVAAEADSDASFMWLRKSDSVCQLWCFVRGSAGATCKVCYDETQLNTDSTGVKEIKTTDKSNGWWFAELGTKYCREKKGANAALAQLSHTDWAFCFVLLLLQLSD